MLKVKDFVSWGRGENKIFFKERFLNVSFNQSTNDKVNKIKSKQKKQSYFFIGIYRCAFIINSHLDFNTFSSLDYPNQSLS